MIILIIIFVSIVSFMTGFLLVQKALSIEVEKKIGTLGKNLMRLEQKVNNIW